MTIVTEWNDITDSEITIDIDALITACPSAVFDDNYGNGVALYEGQSCASYHELAMAAGLDVFDFEARL